MSGRQNLRFIHLTHTQPAPPSLPRSCAPARAGDRVGPREPLRSRQQCHSHWGLGGGGSLGGLERGGRSGRCGRSGRGKGRARPRGLAGVPTATRVERRGRPHGSLGRGPRPWPRLGGGAFSGALGQASGGLSPELGSGLGSGSARHELRLTLAPPDSTELLPSDSAPHLQRISAPFLPGDLPARDPGASFARTAAWLVVVRWWGR